MFLLGRFLSFGWFAILAASAWVTVACWLWHLRLLFNRKEHKELLDNQKLEKSIANSRCMGVAAGTILVMLFAYWASQDVHRWWAPFLLPVGLFFPGLGLWFSANEEFKLSSTGRELLRKGITALQCLQARVRKPVLRPNNGR